MSDEPDDPDSDLLAPIVAILGCIAAGARMPRRVQPGECLIEDAARELGFDDAAWGSAPGGRQWFARAFRRLGDALAAPPEDLSHAPTEPAGRGGQDGLAGTDPGPRRPAGGAGLDSAPARQGRRTGPSAQRGRRAKPGL